MIRSGVQDKAATVWTLSGTGELSLGANFLHWFMQQTEIYVSDPCSGNYAFIFSQAGLAMKSYWYFEANTSTLNFEGMWTDIAKPPSGSIILLQGVSLVRN